MTVEQTSMKEIIAGKKARMAEAGMWIPAGFSEDLYLRFSKRAAFIFRGCENKIDVHGVDLEKLAWAIFWRDLEEFIGQHDLPKIIKEEVAELGPHFLAYDSDHKIIHLSRLWRLTEATEVKAKGKYVPTPFEHAISKDAPKRAQRAIHADARLQALYELLRKKVNEKEALYFRGSQISAPAKAGEGKKSFNQPVAAEALAGLGPVVETDAFEDWWRGLFNKNGTGTATASLLYLQGASAAEACRSAGIANPSASLRQAFTRGARRAFNLHVGSTKSGFNPDRGAMTVTIVAAFEQSLKTKAEEKKPATVKKPPAKALAVINAPEFETWWRGLFSHRGTKSAMACIHYLRGSSVKEAYAKAGIIYSSLTLRAAFKRGQRSALNLDIGEGKYGFNPDRESLTVQVVAAYQKRHEHQVLFTPQFAQWWRGMFRKSGADSAAASLKYLQGASAAEACRSVNLAHPSLHLKSAFGRGERRRLNLDVGGFSGVFAPDREAMIATIVAAFRREVGALPDAVGQVPAQDASGMNVPAQG